MTSALILVRVVATGELREIDPSNPVLLMLDAYQSTLTQTFYGRAQDVLARCSALTWLEFRRGEAAFVLEVDDTDGEEDDGFKWVLCDLVGAPRDLVSTIPAPASDPEIKMAEELGGRRWGRHPS